MAQLTRSAKSSRDWTYNELYAYNISITPTSPADFFPSGADPSLDHLDPSILTSPAIDADDPNLSEATSEYLGYLDFTTGAHEEAAIVDFAAATLRLLGFRAPNITVATCNATHLTICGETPDAQTNVCVIQRHPTTILLVLAKDRMILNDTVVIGAEEQIVAEAIAAFQFNNSKRSGVGLPTLEAMTIPCITMSGTKPTFYLVPVTKELSDAVISGQHPTSQTQVLKCITLGTRQRPVRAGMADLEFRRVALKRFLAFKDLAKSHWEQYMV